MHGVARLIVEILRDPVLGVDTRPAVGEDFDPLRDPVIRARVRYGHNYVARYLRYVEGKVPLWFRSLLGCGKFQFIGTHVSSFQNYSLTKAPKASYDIWLSLKKRFL